MSEKQSAHDDQPTEPKPRPVSEVENLSTPSVHPLADAADDAALPHLTVAPDRQPSMTIRPSKPGSDERSALFDQSPAAILARDSPHDNQKSALLARDVHGSDKFQLTSLIKVLPDPLPSSTSSPLTTTAVVEPNVTHAVAVQPIQPQPLSPATATTATPGVATPVARVEAPVADNAIAPADTKHPNLSNTDPSTKASATETIEPNPPTAVAWLWSVCKTACKFGAIAFLAWFVTVLALITAFRFVDPPQSMLMLTKRLSGEALQHEWVPLDKVALNLRRAVITSEDAKFCRHWGFDLGEIRSALRSTEGYGRGASTITQQLAKNLFLWPGKSYVRKGLEVPLTLAIEGLWPKRRILEVYLNFAEWGPGVFGAEAASQYYYNKPVADVSEREAALLAISLPNPIARDASDPGPKVARRAATLQNRMRVQGVSYCALSGSSGRAKLPKPAER